MPKPAIKLEGRPLLDLVSYARNGPGRRDHLSQSDIELIERTVTRTPEVMVKVLSRGGQNLKAVQNHLAYISRKGELDLESDEGQSVNGKGAEAALLKDWDLVIETDRRQANLAATNKSTASQLGSMPPGTPPAKVLQAVRNFAREEFAFKHRYVLVLHTDEPHPHVHMVVKAVSEHGVRLSIKKVTLRGWRSEFARHLRALGVPANATERAVRGEIRAHKRDGIYRAIHRGESTHLRERTELVEADLAKGGHRNEAGKKTLLDTRREALQGWEAIAGRLNHDGKYQLADKVNRFIEQMQRPLTEKEQLALKLSANLHKRAIAIER